MSLRNVETLRGLADAFNERDLDRAIGTFDPEAEWQMAREDPDSTIQRGAQAIRGMWDSWLESYPDLQLRAEEVVPADDRVFVWVRITGSGAASGAEVEMQEAYVYTMRDGRIVRVEEYFDRREGLAAAGLDYDPADSGSR
jgi:ketosteroid isomerase-like protein